ncbi:hypothetical protein [Gluconobacter albidus]|uniref:hypothetical protein n=1 Tax=Gluconobacter albidus TaxID=318683 RepID=UPI0030B7C7B4
MIIQQFPIRRQKRANCFRAKKYLAIECQEIWGGSHFSRTGWSTYIDRADATPGWIGENFRQSIQSSEYFKTPGVPFPREAIAKVNAECDPLMLAFWGKLAEEFRFADWRATHAKTAMVFASWDYELTDHIELRASKGRGGGHSAWLQGEDDGTVFHVSISASNEELGNVIIQALNACKSSYL